MKSPHRRFLLFLPAPAVVVALASVAPMPVAGQAPPAAAKVSGKTSSAKAWTAPRTPDGQPDLQGIWSNPTITPFERPAKVSGKAVLTEQEAAELEARAEKARVDGPAQSGDVGNYNQ